MIAIHTKYLNPTNTKGARIKAQAWYGYSLKSVIVPYDHAGDAHEVAAEALRQRYKLGKSIRLVGSTIDGNGNVYSVEYSSILSVEK